MTEQPRKDHADPHPAPGPDHASGQPDPSATSDGDASWTEDPITADPHEDRSVDAVIKRTSHRG